MEDLELQHIRAFSFKELTNITNEFSEEHVIGSGGSGVVYKGVLNDGEVIAVKKLHGQRYDSSGKTLGNAKAQFHNEVMNLLGIQHPNIIKLLGYCYEVRNIVTEYEGKRVFASVEERVLCLEYMQGGCLKDHLSDANCKLEWHVCYNIMKGICEGLKYIHTGSTNPVYHLDLKPENIFLDGNMIPKIGDFGVSRLPAGSKQTYVTQNISGTIGFMPPEYIHRKEISSKFDIFSLGVIMIHVIAGHKGNQDYAYMPPQEFVELVLQNWRKQLELTMSSHLLEQVRKCTEIALRCVDFHREKRPAIIEIVDELNKIYAKESSARDQNTEEQKKQPDKGKQNNEAPDLPDRIVSDPRLRTKQNDLEEIFGIESSRNKVLRMMGLMDSRGQLGKHIISIAGMGGLGKTTLARAVYVTVREQYDCSAWVSIDRNPNIRNVLTEILIQIDEQKYMHTNTENFDGRMVIDELRIQLANKRYLIVIDDVWDLRAWEIIKSVLVDIRNGSNVITTTRNLDVAKMLGAVYMLGPLSHQHSEELFNKKMFGAKGKAPTIPPEMLENVLQKCAGVPLAIITISSLLAGKSRDEWSKVYNSVGFGYGVNEDVNSVRNILLLSYNDLPLYARTCLLHLNMFPENYLFRKETLIWMWVAEGFVYEEPGIGLFEAGEKLFRELITRSFITPVEDSSCCIVNGFRVHDLVLDMISSLSTEENFVTVLDGSVQHHATEIRARRLAVRAMAAELHDPLVEKRTERVRSFNTVKCHFGTMISFSRFILLRVLSIEECTFMEYHPYELKFIGNLKHLRYLGLYNTPIHELPNEVRDLIFLQTLDLRGTMVKVLPLTVDTLRHLKCLRADENTTVPGWIGNLTSLQELWLDDVSKSVNFVREVGKLKDLRELEFSIEGLDKDSNKILVKSLRALSTIQVLRLISSRPVEEANWESYVPPQHLRELCLAIAFPGLPKWINASFVPNLSHLNLNVQALLAKDVGMLGNLRSLVFLKLLIPSDVSLSIKGDGTFPKLRSFHTSAPFRFLVLAMQALQFLHFKVDVRALRRAGFALDDFASLENLLCLEVVKIEVNSRGAREVHVVEIEEALKRTIDNHPNHPTSDIKRI